MFCFRGNLGPCDSRFYRTLSSVLFVAVVAVRCRRISNETYYLKAVYGWFCVRDCGGSGRNGSSAATWGGVSSCCRVVVAKNVCRFVCFVDVAKGEGI